MPSTTDDASIIGEDETRFKRETEHQRDDAYKLTTLKTVQKLKRQLATA